MLELKNITVEYPSPHGFTKAVDDVSLSVREQNVFALVGESGCGKTSLIRALFGLQSRVCRQGAAFWGVRDLLAMPQAELRRILGNEIGIVLQNPYHAFDPVYTIGAQIAEAICAHRKLSRTEKHSRVTELLEMVELSANVAELYPHELSGGMLQRAQLAAALSNNPSLLIADEPTSALDVTVQAQIIDLLDSLKRDKKLTLFIITHDFGVVAALADTVAVMGSGKIVESGRTEDVLGAPSHPLTQKLLLADAVYR